MSTANPIRAAAAPLVRASALLVLAACLAGCTSLLGGKKEPVTTYAPVARGQAESWPSVKWDLAIGRPLGARGADSLRIAVRPTPAELQVYKGAQWAKTPSEMIEDAVLHTLEDSSRIPAVVRQGSGVSAAYRLLLDVRRFESDYAGAAVPSATIEVTAKLLNVKSQQLAGSHTFLKVEPASSANVPDVVAAFETGLTELGVEIGGWTLATGETFERSGAARVPAR